MPVPTTILSGALGVGKTSAVLSLLDARPPGAAWVVLVNETGELGIDGARLSGGADAGGPLAVRELAGGCLCCQSALPVHQSVLRVLDELAPERLIIECSGLADPGRVADQLRAHPRLRRALAIGAPITLVDPRAVVDPARRSGPWRAQVEAARVLVLNRLDLCDGATVRAALAWADGLFPEKEVVATTVGGVLDPAWLALPGRPPSGPGGLPLAPDWVDQTRLLPPALGRRLFRRVAHSADHQTAAWRWPPAVVFAHDRLLAALADVARPGGVLPQGTMRLKGLVHTTRGWWSVDAGPDGTPIRPSAWRADSRIELICAPRPSLDRPALDRCWAGALRPD